MNFHEVGTIVTPDEELWKLSDNIKLVPAFVQDYPHLFRLMHWSEERKPEDMPKYIKYLDGEVEEVYFTEDGMCNDKYGNKFYLVDGVNPSTEQEYLEYINPQK